MDEHAKVNIFRGTWSTLNPTHAIDSRRRDREHALFWSVLGAPPPPRELPCGSRMARGELLQTPISK